jgi:hypothetical protein
VLLANLIALSRLNRCIIVVKIVELKLSNLDLGILGKNVIENVSAIVEGDAEMTDLTFLLKLHSGLVGAARLIMLEIILILSVHKIEIKILNSASLKLAFKEGTNICLGVKMI